ncbi:MAG: class I SAM-dependent methyltransferase [Xanthomonadales bacterium]|nr:class I SAM-dependent methyltransferase [Xanthomonadales bacterium]
MSAPAPTVEEGLRAAKGPRFVRALSRCLGGHPAPDTTIHPLDQMFLHSLAEHRDIGAALSQYFNIARQQHDAFAQVIEALLPGRSGLRILDFACGFGRLLRFLPQRYPAANIWAGEIQPEALRFVGETFGVNTLASTGDPADFAAELRFDVIWVASLFSHLPDHLFRGWLARLHSMLAADGILCFSVRPSDLRAGANSGGEFSYSPDSEVSPLGGEIYGTAHASQAYVDEVVRSAVGGRGAFRLVRALANEQDLYVLARDPAMPLDPLQGFRRGPWGWLDRKRIDSAGRVSLQGWAGSMDGGGAASPDVRVGGEPMAVACGILRNDVAAAFDDPDLLHSGWSVDGTAGGMDSGSAWIEVTANEAGRTALVYAGELEAEAAGEHGRC